MMSEQENVQLVLFRSVLARWAGKGALVATVLITGASTGIGLAAAVALARARHDVFATMRSPDRSPALRSIAQQESLPVTILRLDVDSDELVQSAVH